MTSKEWDEYTQKVIPSVEKIRECVQNSGVDHIVISVKDDGSAYFTYHIEEEKMYYSCTKLPWNDEYQNKRNDYATKQPPSPAAGQKNS